MESPPGGAHVSRVRRGARAAGRGHPAEHELETVVPRPGNEAFVSAYRQRWGEEPDNHAAAAYAAGQLIEAGVEAGPRRRPHGPQGSQGPYRQHRAGMLRG